MSPGSMTLGHGKYIRALSRSKPSDISYNDYRKEKKEKKMNWFKKKFAQWSREAWENVRDESRIYATDTIRQHDSISGKSSVRFTIYAASGGHIIEYYKNDRYKEHDGPELVIVNQGAELGKAVEHILTMEALKS